MPRRRRWTPVRGTGNRIYDARERAGRGCRSTSPAAPAFAACLGPARRAPEPRRAAARRAGAAARPHRRRADVAARAPRPAARRSRRRASGWPSARWSEERRPQRARGRGARVERALGRPARARAPLSVCALRAGRGAAPRRRLDLALDLQGDVRALLLLRETGAAPARRATRTRVAPTCSRTWCRSTKPSRGSSRTAARWRVGGRAAPAGPAPCVDPLTAEDRAVRHAPLRAPGLAATAAARRHPPERRAPREAVGRSRAGRAVARRLQRGARGHRRSSPARAADQPLAPSARARPARPADRPHGQARRASRRMAVIAAARPLPLARHRAHAHGLRGGHAVGQRVRAVGPGALLLGRQPAAARHASRGRAPRAVVRALQPHPRPPAECAGRGAARMPARGRRRGGVRGGRTVARGPAARA